MFIAYSLKNQLICITQIQAVQDNMVLECVLKLDLASHQNILE